jgi:hypothetical protein
LIEIETLTYSGLWLEGELSLDGLQKARALLSRHHWETAGALIPAQDIHAHQLAERADFQRVGEFEWWLLNGSLA